MGSTIITLIALALVVGALAILFIRRAFYRLDPRNDAMEEERRLRRQSSPFAF